MKKRYLILAVTLLGVAVIPRMKAAPIAYKTGDIFLGFETTGGNYTSGSIKDLLIDIGQYSSFATFKSFTIASDLNSVFGVNKWQTGKVSFGAIGVTLSGSHWGTVYETSKTNNLNTLAGSSTVVKQDYQVLSGTTGIGYQNLSKYITSSWTTYGVQESSTTAGSWSSYIPSAAAFGVSGNNIEGPIGSKLNFYSATYTTGINKFTNTPYTISVSTLGAISITKLTTTASVAVTPLGLSSVTAVPEPSTYALFGLGALLLFITYRRNRSSVASF